ncbi:MAG: hypothetical protein ACJ76I_11755 [Gaiellaceae bacterium]
MIARLAVVVAAFAGVAWVWTGVAPSRPPAVAVPPRARPVSVLRLPQLGPPLPASATHGLVLRLRQYPDVTLASERERNAARRLLERMRATASRWSDPVAARAAGFGVRRPHRLPGETRVMWFHSENRAWHSDAHYLDPSRPDTLIYADLPNRPLVVVGVMISMPRGLRGATPGGPITRWHSHIVCVRDGRRGLAPRANGTCAAGERRVQGSEMMHIWFTRDLRSAFAIHAPGPELCSSHLLPASVCRDPRAFHVM